MPSATETLILGGGLAGAAAAIQLARNGCAVTLVERELTPKHKVCGEFLSTEALHLLSFLGIDPAAHSAEPIQTVRLASGSRLFQARLPFPAQSLTRRCLDGLLLDAAEQAGATVLRGVAVEALTQRGSKWQATLSNGRTLQAPHALLATGKHDLRGFPRPQGLQGDLLALKMYFRLTPAETDALRHAVELLLFPKGYAGLQLVENETANLCGLVRRSHLAKIGGWSGFLGQLTRSNAHAARRLCNAEPLLGKPLALSAIPYGFVRRHAVAPTLYAVGDQAAVIPSFTGDGMSIALYTGLQAAQAILAGQSAPAFQRALHRQLRSQVMRATVLSRSLVDPSTRPLLTAVVGVWPGVMRGIASLTRLPKGAVEAATCSGGDHSSAAPWVGGTPGHLSNQR